MREMPHGQWVAFDGHDTVHKCGQDSEYDEFAGTHSAGHRVQGRTARSESSPSLSLPEPKGTTEPSISDGEPISSMNSYESARQSEAQKQGGWPAWVWILLAIVLLYFLLKG